MVGAYPLCLFRAATADALMVEYVIGWDVLDTVLNVPRCAKQSCVVYDDQSRKPKVGVDPTFKGGCMRTSWRQCPASANLAERLRVVTHWTIALVLGLPLRVPSWKLG